MSMFNTSVEWIVVGNGGWRTWGGKRRFGVRVAGGYVALLWRLGWRLLGIFAGDFPWVRRRRCPSPGGTSGVPQRSARGGWAGFGGGGGRVCLSGLGLSCPERGVGALPLLACRGSAGWLGFLGGRRQLSGVGVLHSLADLCVGGFPQLLAGQQQRQEDNKTGGHNTKVNSCQQMNERYKTQDVAELTYGCVKVIL